MKNYSIGSWAFLFNQDVATADFHAVVHKLMHMGYKGIELFAHVPHPNPDTLDTIEKRHKLRKMVVDHGLQFSGVVPVFATQKLWSVEDQSPYLAEFQKHLEFAHDLGITTLRLDTLEPVADVARSGVEPPMILDRCIRAFDACAKKAADQGITIAWEFEPCFALNQPSEIVALVDAVRGLGNPNFGVLYDTCNAHLCAAVGAGQVGEKETLPGGGLELLQNLTGKIAHLHLIDSDGTLNETGAATHVPLGKGVLKFDQLVPELLACGVPNDWWCVDLRFVPDAWNATADCKRYLDKLRHKFVPA
jgi:sugar phosphate isomerase/epimerase